MAGLLARFGVSPKSGETVKLGKKKRVAAGLVFPVWC
jgi:hypothetical protein